MNLSEYKLKRVHIIEFENRYAVEGCLLGKHFTMQISDNCVLELEIPPIIKKDGLDKIGIPNIFSKYGVDIEKWGKIDNYVTINDVTTINASISAVFVKCYTKNDEADLKTGVIQNLARKVLHALHVINPHVIRINSDTAPNDLCKISISVMQKDYGKRQAEVSLPPMLIDSRAPKLAFTDIKRSIRNYEKKVTLPYEMLENARVNLVNHDTRAAVLNCATAIEVTLKKMIIDYLQSNDVPEKLKVFIIKKADGYAKVVEMLKKLSISLRDMNDVKVHVMDVRNNVIHKGDTPTHEEAHKALSCTREALTDYEVRMFD